MVRSPFAKVLVIAVLALAFVIPLSFVRSVVSERQHRRDEAVKEMSQSWGAPQTLTGPYLAVPFRVTWETAEGKVATRLETLTILPEALEVTGTLVPEVRRRGLFAAVLYGLDVSVKGRFPKFSGDAVRVPEEAILWERATLVLGLSDTRGIREKFALVWGGTPVDFSPSPFSELVNAGVHVNLPELANAESRDRGTEFSFHVHLSGSETLHFVPVARETSVSLSSTWPHPSFQGAFLPETRNISEAGFSASWRVSHFGRNYPQEWRSDELTGASVRTSMEASAFGLRFYQPADDYQQTTRALKYGLLFVALTFLTFFLFELFSGLRLHPLQYLLVGSALALFYLLLVSLSEHRGFASAYAVSALAVVVVVSGYSAAILEKRLRAVSVALLLSALYGYLFVLLRLETYALLMGSLALFALLSLAMYLTRRVDWYAVAAPGAPDSPSRRDVPPRIPLGV